MRFDDYTKELLMAGIVGFICGVLFCLTVLIMTGEIV